MKIGYFCNSTNWGNKKTYNQILEEIREIATYCDQHDWDSIWFSEHHFSHEGMEICPNPILLSSDIAARTKNIRIGQAASIITFSNLSLFIFLTIVLSKIIGKNFVTPNSVAF